MTKEQLMAMGLSEEQATKVAKAFTDTLNGNYVPKHRFDEVNEELKTTKSQVEERDKQIEGLKKFEGDAKALQDKIKELEDTNKATDSKYKEALALERKKNAIRLELLQDESGKPYDVDMVMGLFNLEQIVIDEATGKISSGFKEQNDAIRKEKAFLFSPKEAINKGGDGKPAGWKPAGTPPADGDKGGGGADSSVSFGKSLAQIKLSMMGIQPTGAEGSNN